MKRFFAKGFAALLAVMMFFTLLSRAADSFLVARVFAETYSAKKIEHIVNTEAVVQKNLELPVMTEPGILVKTVYVQEGSPVKAGDILAKLDEAHLAEQIGLLRDEIRSLRLQNEAITANRGLEEEEKKKQGQRAREDYDKAVRKNEENLRRAEEEVRQAEEEINRFAGGAGASLSQEESEAKKTQLWQTYFDKKQACEDVKRSGADEVEAAARALEDAQAKGTADPSLQINAIHIEQKEEALEAYKKLEEAGGIISAGEAGTVTGVFVATGQMTGDTAAFTMASTAGGIRLVAVVKQEEARYVEIGDAVTVDKNGIKYEDFSVTAIRQTADGGAEITAESAGHADEFLIGEGALIRIVKQSGLYSVAVPLSAVHTEQGKNYVFVLDQKPTVLGTEYFTRKAQVRIIDKNSDYAALEEGTLGRDNLIVTESNQYISAGDRVRLQTS